MRLRRRQGRAFTLIEMLVVVAIIATLTVLIAPAASTVVRGTQLTQASSMMTDQLAYARQQALTKNISVELRIIRFADPELPGESIKDSTTGQYRAFQLLQVLDAGIAVPLDKVQFLPRSIVVVPGQYSSLLPTSSSGSASFDPTQPLHRTAQSSDPDLPRNVKKNYDYFAFRFLPDGSTSLQPATNWFLTLVGVSDLPKLSNSTALTSMNFFILQLDPASGATRAYRPTAK